jgi:hypothetical protein
MRLAAPVRPVVARAGKKPEFNAPEIDVEELKVKATAFANDTAAIIKVCEYGYMYP